MDAERALLPGFGFHLLQVDGGIAPSTVEHAAAQGPNVLVSGSAIISAADPRAVIGTLRTAVDAAAATA